MVPNREICELANALLYTDEFADMMKYRNKITMNNNLKSQVRKFEEEREAAEFRQEKHQID